MVFKLELFRRIVATVVATAGAAAGCADGPPIGTPPVTTIGIQPAFVRLTLGDTARVTVRALGPAAPVAPSIRWRSEHPGVAQLDTTTQGYRPVTLRAVGVGSAVVVATLVADPGAPRASDQNVFLPVVVSPPP